MASRLLAALVTALAALALAPGCGAPARFVPAWPDTPRELRDDGDREQATDGLWAMPAGAARDRARAPIAAAIAARIRDAIDDGEPLVAAGLLDQLIGLWQADPFAVGPGVAPHAAVVRELRAAFARSGALAATAQATILLAEIEPAERASHLAVLDEVIDFADDLAVAEHGPEAIRSQPLAVLQPAALSLPLGWLVDRYVALLVDRQRAVAALLAARGASMQLIRAHHDFLSSARRIANALARAGRPGEIHRQLARLAGDYGADRELTIRAEVVADQPTAAAYARLAAALLGDDPAADPTAALAVCQAGLARFPDDPGLLAAGGGAARALGRIDQAISHYERALHAPGEVDPAVALQLGKLYADRIHRLAAGGRPSAAHAAWHAAHALTTARASRRPHAVWREVSALAESGLGRGLASQGLIDDARQALTASIERAPSIDAYETLATIAVQTERYADAQRWADDGLALLGDQSAGDRYRRAKLERLAADGLRRAGKPRPAAERYLVSLRTWAKLGDNQDLPRAIVAERELDMGRTMWWLGDPAKAIELAMQAIDSDPESEDLATAAVAFLIEAGRYRDALDVYHRSLGERAIGVFPKTYMSLWIVGAAARAGEPRDRLAADYLAHRRGEAWHEMLAQLATGTLSLAALRPHATTGPRRAELTFYGVTLGVDPAAATPAGRHRLLEQVVAARLVLDAEHDLARTYLERP
jgi:tetratricopeptide (TPR) repeat protein